MRNQFGGRGRHLRAVCCLAVATVAFNAGCGGTSGGIPGGVGGAILNPDFQFNAWILNEAQVGVGTLKNTLTLLALEGAKNVSVKVVIKGAGIERDDVTLDFGTRNVASMSPPNQGDAVPKLNTLYAAKGDLDKQKKDVTFVVPTYITTATLQSRKKLVPSLEGQTGKASRTFDFNPASFEEVGEVLRPISGGRLPIQRGLFDVVVELSNKGGKFWSVLLPGFADLRDVASGQPVVLTQRIRKGDKGDPALEFASQAVLKIDATGIPKNAERVDLVVQEDGPLGGGGTETSLEYRTSAELLRPTNEASLSVVVFNRLRKFTYRVEAFLDERPIRTELNNRVFKTPFWKTSDSDPFTLGPNESSRFLPGIALARTSLITKITSDDLRTLVKNDGFLPVFTATVKKAPDSSESFPALIPPRYLTLPISKANLDNNNGESPGIDLIGVRTERDPFFGENVPVRFVAENALESKFRTVTSKDAVTFDAGDSKVAVEGRKNGSVSEDGVFQVRVAPISIGDDGPFNLTATGVPNKAGSVRFDLLRTSDNRILDTDSINVSPFTASLSFVPITGFSVTGKAQLFTGSGGTGIALASKSVTKVVEPGFSGFNETLALNPIAPASVSALKANGRILPGRATGDVTIKRNTGKETVSLSLDALLSAGGFSEKLRWNLATVSITGGGAVVDKGNGDFDVTLPNNAGADVDLRIEVVVQTTASTAVSTIGFVRVPKNGGSVGGGIRRPVGG